MRHAEIAPARIDWVDYAKGICIILVVMMHSTLGVEKALGETGALHAFIEWAKPFRMPDFFLISGLFLARRINTPWRSYCDSKIVHFFYFYVLWMAIQFAFKSPGIIAEQGAGAALQAFALGFVEPFGTLWFIYILAVFFAVTKLLKDVPPLMMFVMAALLEMLPLHTGWILIDEFASRYVYFFAGYWLAPQIFKAAEQLWLRNAFAVLALLYIWSSGHSAVMVAGYSELPGVGLVLGFAGAAAVIATGVLIARSGMARWLSYLGANSIVIYLSFFLFMAMTRTLGLRLMPDIHVDLLAALTTISGIIGSLLLFWSVRHTPLSLLFKRPNWAKLKPLESKGMPNYSAGHDIINLEQPQTR